MCQPTAFVHSRIKLSNAVVPSILSSGGHSDAGNCGWMDCVTAISAARNSNKTMPPASETATVRPNPVRPQETAKQPASDKIPLIATFVLTPGGERGLGETNQIKIPASATKVRFRINLASNEYDTFDASLNKVEGETLFVLHRVKAQASKNGETIFVVLPASVFPSGTSILTIRDIRKAGSAQRVGRYVVSVQRKISRWGTRALGSFVWISNRVLHASREREDILNIGGFPTLYLN